jgi:uncharacterized protein
VTALEPHPIGIPTPNPTVDSAPFWEGCKVGELRYQRCANGHSIFSPRTRCRVCLSGDLRWETSAGAGTIYSYTIVWRPQTQAFRTPYAPAIVDLDEGYQMLADIVGCDHEEVAVGMPVTVEFHPISEEFTLAYFTPRRARAEATNG